MNPLLSTFSAGDFFNGSTPESPSGKENNTTEKPPGHVYAPAGGVEMNADLCYNFYKVIHS